jgi:hypothetical protein
MPMFLQDIIHKFEVGSGSRVLKMGVGLVALVALALFYNMAAFENFSTAEAMDGAQLARNVSEGKGFTTDFVRPFGLYLLRRHGAKGVEGRESRVEGQEAAQSMGGDRRGLAGLVERCPDLSNGPVYPLVLAGVLRVMPFGYRDVSSARGFTTYSPELWIAGFNQLLLVVCACLVFSLARRLFDEPVAWVSAAVFGGTELFWRHSVSGLPTLWMTFLVLVLVLVLVRLDATVRDAEAPGAAAPAGAGRPGLVIFLAVGAGMVTGMLGLTRYALLALIVPVIGYLLTLATSVAATGGAPGTSRPVSARVLGVAAALGFIALVGPWLGRNYAVGGTLFGTASYAALAQTVHFPGDSLMRSFSPDFNTVTTSAITRKVLVNLREVWLHGLPTLGGSWVTALFLAGLVVPFRSVINGRVRALLLAFLWIVVVAQAVVSPGEAGVRHLASDYLTVLAPLVFIFGISLLFNLLDQFTAVAVRYGILAMFFVAACAPLALTFAAPRNSPLAYPPYYPPSLQSKAAYVPDDGWMVSDMPWAIAWYGDRKAAWLPLKHGTSEAVADDDFYSLHKLKPVRALHLSDLTLSKLDATAIAQWRQSEGTDPDWERFREHLKGVAEAAGGKQSQAITNALVEVYSLADKHWVRGSGTEWASFLLGILVNREVPTGFPLKMAPLGIMPEIFLTDTERPATKTIKLSEQADRQ